MPHPRVIFPALPEAVPVIHNEEHLVLENPSRRGVSRGFGALWFAVACVPLGGAALGMSRRSLGPRSGNLAGYREGPPDKRVMLNPIPGDR